MQLRRTLLGGACLALAALAMAGTATAQERQIKLASIANAGSIWHKSMDRMKEYVEAETKGRIKVQVFTDGQLGDIGGMMSAMQLGTLEMAYYGVTSIIQLRGAEALNIVYVPYLFKNVEWAAKVQNSPEFMEIYDKVAASAGVRVVGAWGERSPRALQTTRGPITRPEQVKGMRLRIPPIEMLKVTFEKLGAQNTPMGMMEIYNALGRGTVEGQDNGLDLSIPGKFHEVAKYWSATDHAYELVGLFASERVWRTLSAEDKAIFTRASKVAGDLSTELTRQLNEDAIAQLKAAGVTYTVPDRDAFRQALADAHLPYEGKLWPAGMFDRVRKMQE